MLFRHKFKRLGIFIFLYLFISRVNSGSINFINIHPFEYNGFGNIEAVYSTSGADTMVYLRNVKTQTVITRYRKTGFYFATYGITAMTATWLNATYFNPPNLRQLNVTSAVRDSLVSWGLAPLGTIIYNTTLDTLQVRKSASWRSF